MSDNYLQLRRIAFSGPKRKAEVCFQPGVNVICGASDTGKSFLAESIDFMLGGTSLRDIPERVPYGEAMLDMVATSGKEWRLRRATSGGDFVLEDLRDGTAEKATLKQSHQHDRTNNVSGFLLEKIGLLGRRILKSSKKGTTQSLSFRNLARLIIVQEGEIQQQGSPFWGGQYTLKTAELATIKLLLTGIDDSNVVSASVAETDDAGQLALLEELISDLNDEITDLGKDEDELSDQSRQLDTSLEEKRQHLLASQRQLEELADQRRELFHQRAKIQDRLDEISDLMTRFDLLNNHYTVDIARLQAIQESGSMFAHVDPTSCPLCGADPEAQHLQESCQGDVEAIVNAATAELKKIYRLQKELDQTVADLQSEADSHKDLVSGLDIAYENVDAQIRETLAPQLGDARTGFETLVEQRSLVRRELELFSRLKKLEAKKAELMDEEPSSSERAKIVQGLPDNVAHAISQKISDVLKAWDFPGDCLVHFDKTTTDFVIDGKPRGSRGKGLRAITHAAVTIGLLEYCQENDLAHPGFVVLDSPLLAYFKPEGDDEATLKGTNLKEQFYRYLVKHHKTDSQIIIIENQHPPETVERDLAMTVFTGNPDGPRFGLL